jgi:putative ABC transport system permease protein
MFERLRSDFREALRELKTTPWIVTVAVLTLGASIGMNLAMFSLVDRAFLSPPAGVQHSDRIFTLAFHAPGEAEGDAGMVTTSYVTFKTVRDDVPAVSAAAAWQRGPASVVKNGEQLQADTLLVSGSYFEVLGTHALAGRTLRTADEDGQTEAAVLSYPFWKAAYAGDAGAIGRRLTVGGIEYTIAGVMPRGFSGHSAASVDVWLPIATALRGNRGWDQNPFQNIVSIIVRVADGATVTAATSQAAAALDRGVALRNITGGGAGTTQRRIALWLTAVALLVLLIGLANASTLLLVRGARRRRESAIRAALGASRGRLLSQAFIGAAILACAATGVSLVLGYWLEDAVRHVLLPSISESGGLHARTAFAATIAGCATAAVAAAAGAWSLPLSLQMGALADRGVRHARVQKTLLVVQTAVCVLLLAGAGMFARSLYKLLGQDFGMRMENVLVIEFEQGSGLVVDRRAVMTDALDRLRSMPGVHSVTTFQTLPFGAHHIPPIAIPGHTEPPNAGGQLPFLIAATPELFDMLDIRMLEGRRFVAADERGDMIAIVNETMARAAWPGESAIGKCFRIGFDADFDPATAMGAPVPSAALPCRRIVGVARDVRQRSVVPQDNEAALMQYYVPVSQVPPPPGGVPAGPNVSGLLLRTTGDPAALIAPIRRLVVHGRPNLPYLQVRPYSQLLERQVQPWRLGTTLLGMFSALALAVAAIGLYAAFAHAVALRRREMAIRIAVGARPARVLTMILGEASRLAAYGIAVGIAGAVLAGHSLERLLFGIVPADPIVLGGAAAAMLLVVMAATTLPARRAAQADPNSLLRAE